VSVVQPTPNTRDAALGRRRTIAITAGAAGVGAVGVILGAVAMASGGSAASTSGTTAAPSQGDSGSGAPQDSGSSSGATSAPDSLGAPQAAPTSPPQNAGGRQPHAVTGGSGH
jgi:hypothetical protein